MKGHEADVDDRDKEELVSRVVIYFPSVNLGSFQLCKLLGGKFEWPNVPPYLSWYEW